MRSQFRAWSLLALALSVALGLAASTLRSGQRVPSYDQPAFDIVVATCTALGLVALVTGLATFLAPSAFAEPASSADSAARRRPYATLLVISFVALFVELMLIRYCSSQIRIFSFYKNVPLIACFLGLGLGCCLARGTPRHAVLFLLWLVPLATFLSVGSITVSQALGRHAAIASSEQILGDFIPGAEEAASALGSQVMIAAFCVATFIVITLLFTLLGRLMGEAFERVERLPGYTVNIAGSLAGILGFVALSTLELPPWLWFAVGLGPLLWWIPRGRAQILAVTLIALSVAAVAPRHGETVWSRYQKLVGHRLPPPGGTLDVSHSYLVEISDVFYQRAVDRRPVTLARTGVNPYPHYDALYARLPRPERVLVVGAGTGNDVAAALRAGARSVVAVDIDPAILAMGRENHPERPYEHPGVELVVDDARHAFRVQRPQSFDLVLFGLLDSHTQLGMSSVRLDNYVFTSESLAEAARLVKPGGYIVIAAATFERWFRDRIVAMLGATVGGDIESFRQGAWVTYVARVDEASEDGATDSGDPGGDDSATAVTVPTDDWPFLYLPEKGIPQAYLWVVGSLLVASIAILRGSGLKLGSFSSYHGHLFFLGAGFLLMEVHAINRLALLFGTTWLVSAVTIAIVLLLIVAANLTVALWGRVPYGLAYAALGTSLALSFWIEPAAVLGEGLLPALGFGLALLSPVYFAGLVFARSFRMAQIAAPAMGANILGSVVGGWIEYSTMAFGMRALVLLAFGLYALSLVMLVLDGHARGTQRRERPSRVRG